MRILGKKRSKTKNLGFHIKKLEKRVQYKPKAKIRKKYNKIERKSIKLESGKQQEKTSKIKSWFFEKIMELINL